MVGDVFREYHKRNGYVSHRNGADVTADVLFAVVAVKRFEEREPGDPFHVGKLAEVDYFEPVGVCKVADKGEDCRQCVTRKDTDYEGDKTHCLVAVHRANDYNRQRYKSAQKSDVRGSRRNRLSRLHRLHYAVNFFKTPNGLGGEHTALHKVAYCVACKTETDDCNGRSDYDRGHDFVDPGNARKLDNQRKHHIHKTRKQRADDKSEIPE